MNTSKINDPRSRNRWLLASALGGAAAPTLRRGRMPSTDFRYEEFEGLLGSFFLTLKPLRTVDPAAFEEILVILLGFAY